MAHDTHAMAEGAQDSEIIEQQIEALKSVESLADTPFSALFHEARTTTPDTYRTNGYSGVTVQVRARDGEVETSNPVKTRRGEHLRGTDAWDGKVSLAVKPFMDVPTARDWIIQQLRDLQQTYQAREQREAERQKIESGEWSR